MSVPMRKRRTETIKVGRDRFQVSPETAHAVLVLLKGTDRPNNEVVFAEQSETIQKLDARYTPVGACLRGARIKEGLSQVELARTLEVTQSNLSKMEHGKRPIGKKMAQRIARVLRIDYRLFL